MPEDDEGGSGESEGGGMEGGERIHGLNIHRRTFLFITTGSDDLRIQRSLA